MVLKRKLPTQVAQDQEAENKNATTEESAKKEPQEEGSEPWVFSGGDSVEGAADKAETTEEKKTEPEPWSSESLESGEKKEGPANTAVEEEITTKPEPASAESTGDYPWAIKPGKDSQMDGWKIEDEPVEKLDDKKDPIADDAKPPLAPSNDIYASLGGKKEEKEEKSGSDGTPPWQKVGGGSSSDKSPPIIPENTISGGGGSMIKTLVMLVVVIGVFAGGYMALFKKRDEVAEVTARWTGTLNEVSQEIEESSEDDPQPEDVISFNLGGSKKPKTEDIETAGDVEDELVAEDDVDSPDEMEKTADASDKKPSNVKVDFVDVDKEEAEKPIAADEETKMPEDLSLFASLQAAIMKEKEEKRTKDMAKVSEEDPEVDPDTLSPEEKVALGQQLRQKTNQEMDDYVKTLTKIKNPSLKPKPSSFFENPEKYKQKADSYGLNKSKESLSYKSNPKNLPVIPEPVVPKKPGVRTLADFEDQIFEPPRDKVRMPRHLTPKVSAAGFPALEILSLVPHKGIIAFARGKEGILMIGEQIEGWELIAVQNEYAEFHNGKRKHVVALEVIR
jgi:hypothetical protein